MNIFRAFWEFINQREVIILADYRWEQEIEVSGGTFDE